ncbi:hypothetical protein FOG50_03636 [Hanseniaspora uvarum]|nr:hypothetical protein FOG50_03636 [Hanseniaspora uvarum]GMM42621.1 O-phospho-L-serine:2-oxoglutarate transaminase [Hanseniaspora uvarum]
MSNSLPERNEVQYYFGAGPAQLPKPVILQLSKDIVNINNQGIGIGEISHRSKLAQDIIDTTKGNLYKLLSNNGKLDIDQIKSEYDVFFLQGGGTTGFSSIPLNLKNLDKAENKKGGYLITGSWSLKSYQEAKRLGCDAVPLYNDKETNGTFKGGYTGDYKALLSQHKDLSYVYICENETVNGIEFDESLQELAKVCKEKNIELIADLSSDIFSREINIFDYGVIMAGAQKNIGIAGLTLYIVKKSLLNNIKNNGDVEELPIAFDWNLQNENNSCYNTIPMVPLHTLNLVFDHLLHNGGIGAQEKINIEKADKLYSVLDKYSLEGDNEKKFVKLTVSKQFRSKMNVVFNLKTTDLENDFVKKAESKGFSAVKGHRSVGGIRVSIYNAVKLEAVESLIKFIEEFAEQL